MRDFVCVALAVGGLCIGCGETPSERDDAGGVNMDAGARSDVGVPAVPEAGPGDGSRPPADAFVATDAELMDAASGDASVPGGCELGEVVVRPTCPDFVPCGGDLVGRWCYGRVCIPESQLVPPGLDPSLCTVTFDSAGGEVGGFIEFTETTVRRDARLRIDAMVRATGDCAFLCGTIEMQLEQLLGTGTTSCTPGAGVCSCAVSFENGLDVMDTYVTSNNQIIVGADPARRYAYCVEMSGELTLEDLTDDDQDEPGFQTLVPAP